MMSPTNSGLVALDSPLSSVEVLSLARRLADELSLRRVLNHTNIGDLCKRALARPDVVAGSASLSRRFLDACARRGIERGV